ncbi:MAG: nicotinate (nicotinamide) nucleotide adenylyltransferase [Gemmataceae bacterium]
MKIGLFGGTFDPVHQGHLIMVERCREWGKLDAVWFLPSYAPPHKLPRAITRFEQRIEMLQLACIGQPLFRIEPIEKELPPPSYTSETLRELHRRHPGNEFCLIVGGDVLPDLPKWHAPAEVLAQAPLLVVPRPGTVALSAEAVAQSLNLPQAAVRMEVVESPLVDISSREIRRRVAAGQSIRYLVPRAVEEFIREKKLYASGA